MVFYIDKHIGVEYYLKKYCGIREWKPKKCKCYGCAIRQPLSPEIIQKIREMLHSPDFKAKIVPMEDDK